MKRTYRGSVVLLAALALLVVEARAGVLRQEYTGSMMSLDIKGDVRDFFREVAQVSGLELTVDPSVNSTVTVHLKNIPWDLALDAVLRTAGLGSVRDGKTMRIGIANPALGQDRVLMGTVTIVGSIDEVDWKNPRAQFQVNALNGDGAMQIWPIEWESVDYLKEIGVKPNTLRAGDKVILTGPITRRNTIQLITIQRPLDGFTWGSSGPVRTTLTDGAMFIGLLPR